MVGCWRGYLSGAGADLHIAQYVYMSVFSHNASTQCIDAGYCNMSVHSMVSLFCLSVLAKRLAGKDVFEMNYLCREGHRTLISLCVCVLIMTVSHGKIVGPIEMSLRYLVLWTQ